MAFFEKDFILQVIDATDLVGLVKGYVTLTKKGDRWVGLCPFHQENSGSFGVRDGKKIFKCFGCGKGGDAAKFLREIENISFPEAVRRLAGKANIPMPDGTQADGDWKPKHRRRSSEEIAAEAKQRKQRDLAIRAERSLPGLLDKYAWSSRAMAAESAYLPDEPLEEARALLKLFDPGDIVWTGRWQHSIGADDAGTTRAEKPAWFEEVQRRFRPAHEWLEDRLMPGPRICPCAMREGSVSRSDASVKTRRFLVLEHDKLPLKEQGALLRWLHERGSMKLRAVVFTGGKSLHGWFDTPSPADLEELKIMLCGVPPTDPKDKRQRIYGMGFDPSCFVPSQPFRVPGWANDKTGKPVKLVYFRP